MDLVVYGMRYCCHANAELCGKCFLLFSSRISSAYFSHVIKGQLSVWSVAAVFVISKLMNVVTYIFKPRDPFKVGCRVISFVAIFVIYLSFALLFFAECLGNKNVPPSRHAPSAITDPHHKAPVSFADACLHFMNKSSLKAYVSNPGKIGNLILRVAVNRHPPLPWDSCDGGQMRVARHGLTVNKQNKVSRTIYA